MAIKSKKIEPSSHQALYRQSKDGVGGNRLPPSVTFRACCPSGTAKPLLGSTPSSQAPPQGQQVWRGPASWPPSSRQPSSRPASSAQPPSSPARPSSPPPSWPVQPSSPPPSWPVRPSSPPPSWPAQPSSPPSWPVQPSSLRAFLAGAAFFAAAFLAGAAFFAGAFLAGAAFFAVAITISLIKLQKALHRCSQCRDSPPGGLLPGHGPATVAPVR